MNSLRRAVMDEMDNIHHRTDGTRPEHILVSTPIWRGLNRTNRFEVINRSDSPKRRSPTFGYMGMRIWRYRTLDTREHDFILLSETVFKQLFPTTADVKQ